MDGYIQLRRGLTEHLRAGRLNLFELGVYAHLLFCADFRTGIQLNSAIHIYYSTGQQDPIRNIQRALECLEKAEYIKRFIVKGKKGDYPILIHRYEVTDGALKGQRLDALSTTTPSELVYFPSVDVDVDNDADGDVTLGGTLGDFGKNSVKNSQKNSEKNSGKKMTAEQLSGVVIDSPTERNPNPATEMTQQDYEKLWDVYCFLDPDCEEADSIILMKYVESHLTDNPVMIAHRLIWAMRVSDYWGKEFSRENPGLAPLLEEMEEITKQYGNYYRERKKPPHELCPSLGKIIRWLRKKSA